MDTEMGLFWKAKIEMLSEELERWSLSPKEEAEIKQDIKDMKVAQMAVRREVRQQMYGGSIKQMQIEKVSAGSQISNEVAARFWEGSSHRGVPEQLFAIS